VNDKPQLICVKLNRLESFEFYGTCLARVAALNHDDRVRRQFSVYSDQSGFVAERIDDPDTIDVRYWGARCASALDIYEFFGNEPLGNFLYGKLGIDVPGLRQVTVS